MILKTLKQLKRIIIGIAGFTVLVVGIVMIALPGPAFIIIPAGLAILATEFIWAQRILNFIKEKTRKLANFRKKDLNES